MAAIDSLLPVWDIATKDCNRVLMIMMPEDAVTQAMDTHADAPYRIRPDLPGEKRDRLSSAGLRKTKALARFSNGEYAICAPLDEGGSFSELHEVSVGDFSSPPTGRRQ